MRYILKTINTETLIDEEEYKYIITQIKSGSEFIMLSGKGLTFKVNAIMEMYPEKSSDTTSDRKKQETGVLNDGERVVKKFGIWCDLNNPDVKLRIEYYPEVALDCVATNDEWEQIKDSGKNYYEFLGIKDKIKRIESKGFTHLLKN